MKYGRWVGTDTIMSWMGSEKYLARLAAYLRYCGTVPSLNKVPLPSVLMVGLSLDVGNTSAAGAPRSQKIFYCDSLPTQEEVRGRRVIEPETEILLPP